MWLFGLGQEKIDAEEVIANLAKSPAWQALSAEEQRTFRLRIEKPYPTDVKKHN